MTDWLLKRHTQMCYYYYCYLTLLSPNTEPGGMVQGRAPKGLGVPTIQGGGVGGLPEGWQLLSQLPEVALPHRDFLGCPSAIWLVD